MEKVTFTIDGKTITCEKNTPILKAALEGGVYIPHLCFHKDLSPFGACRLCVVTIKGRCGVHTSCTTPAEEGLAVTSKSPELDSVRRLAMELMLSAHPEDCSTCPKYQYCELQSLSQYLGANPARLKHRTSIKPIVSANPLMIHDFTRCVLCERCVRACQELRGVGILKPVKDKDGFVRIQVEGDKPLMEADCRFCGACAEVCPTGALRDKDGLVKKELGRELSLVPCRAGCPAAIDIPRYIRLLRQGDYDGAAAVVREKAPFPAALGYICTHKCEDNCRRAYLDGNAPVSIRALKRFAADNESDGWKTRLKRLPETGKRVAVVGSGPAGLTAAYYLAKQGHKITVFEKLPVAGGMMSVGIPAYRLPKDKVNKEIEDIKAVGVQIRLNSPVAGVDDLVGQGYDAVLAAVGTHQGARLPLEGNDLEGVILNTDFLRAAALGHPMAVAQNVVVLGGGNVACDCAGIAQRLGAKTVHLACLEARDKMTASDEEINEVLEDGGQLHNSQTFNKILGENGRVTGVSCSNVLSFRFEEGRAIVDVEPDSEHVYPCGTVIFATGQRPDVTDAFGVELFRGRMVVNEGKCSTKKDKVFACGDGVYGTQSVIAAVDAGRRAASEIDLFLGGDGDISEALAPIAPADGNIGKVEGFSRLERQQSPKLPTEERVTSNALVDSGLCPGGACGESNRCLQCDLRLTISPPVFWGGFDAAQGSGEGV